MLSVQAHLGELETALAVIDNILQYEIEVTFVRLNNRRDFQLNLAMNVNRRFIAFYYSLDPPDQISAGCPTTVVKGF